LSYPCSIVQGSEFNEADFFREIAASGARVVVIGRRAMIAWGLPVATFDQVWQRKVDIPFGADDVSIPVPCVEDLIRTKRWAMRAKDVGDIQMLEALRRSRRAP
jgi:hypothetical protein